MKILQEHIPVLLKEVVELLNPQPNENFVDCTFGFGGHSTAILEKTGPEGKVLGIEIDRDVCELAKGKMAEFSIFNFQFSKDRLILVNDSYTNLRDIIEREKFYPVNGILLDVGMSGWDLEESGRGFSFQKDEPLDMRYGKNFQFSIFNFQTAEEIVNNWSEEELARIFRDFGQERFARNIAKKLVEVRLQQRIGTTGQLVEAVRQGFPRSYKFGRQHFATKIFQALRIAVNNELDNLTAVLPQALEVLAPGGRLAVISFHSLEDRIVKNFFRQQAKRFDKPTTSSQLTVLTKKPITAQPTEVNNNPRARSAKLRVAIKT